MDKKIELKNKTIVLLVVESIILLTSFLFKNYYVYKGYNTALVYTMLVINILIFILGIIVLYLFLKKSDIYDEKKSIIAISIAFVIFIILNTIVVNLINKPLNKGYEKISEKLVSYCDDYVCERYETLTNKSNRDFIIKKTYVDYNGNYNDLEIKVTYNNKRVTKVTAIVFSSSSLFSERLIVEAIEGYLRKLDITINENKIREALENRNVKSIKENNVIYEVSDVFTDQNLTHLKTTIEIKKH